MASMSPWCGSEVERCKHCGEHDYQAGFGPRTLLICDCCQTVGAHLECEERATGIRLSEDICNAGHKWYCEQACEKIATQLATGSGRRADLEGGYSLEFAAAYDPKHRGTASTVETALRLFSQSFDPLVMGNGRNLIDMLCKGFESPDSSDDDEEQYDYSGFRVVVLRKGSVCVSAATIRVFGTNFAEMPFVTTRDGYRREGNLRRLVQGIEERLQGLGVRYLVLPSLRGLLPLWLERFACQPLTLAEAQALESRIVFPDTESAQLLKKALQASEASVSAAAASVPATAAAADAAHCKGYVEGPTLPDDLQAVHTPGTLPSVSEKAAAGEPAGPAEVLGYADGAAHACISKKPVSSAGSPLSSPAKISGAAAPPSEHPSSAVQGPCEVPELQGWTKTVKWRADGKNKDCTYTSPGGRSFRSLKQALAHAEGTTCHDGKEQNGEAGPSNSTALPAHGADNGAAHAAIAASPASGKHTAAPNNGLMLPPPPRRIKRKAGGSDVPLLALKRATAKRGALLDAEVAAAITGAIRHFMQELCSTAAAVQTA